MREKDYQIDTQDGSKIVVRVYQGSNNHGGPALVMLHGGGFCLGGLENEALLCRNFCEKYNGISVNVDYRLAPEYKFPVPVYDCYDALKWVCDVQINDKNNLTAYRLPPMRSVLERISARASLLVASPQAPT